MTQKKKSSDFSLNREMAEAILRGAYEILPADKKLKRDLLDAAREFRDKDDLEWKVQQIENMKAGKDVVCQAKSSAGLVAQFVYGNLDPSRVSYVVHDPEKDMLYFRRRDDMMALYRDALYCGLEKWWEL